MATFSAGSCSQWQRLREVEETEQWLFQTTKCQIMRHDNFKLKTEFSSSHPSAEGFKFLAALIDSTGTTLSLNLEGEGCQ